MKNKYCQIQNKILITPEMNHRILERLTQAETKSEERILSVFPSRRLVASIAACFILVVCLAVGMPFLMNLERGGPIQQSSPVQEYQTLDELAKELPFTLAVPNNLPAGYALQSSAILFGESVQITYSNGTNEIVFRMAQGDKDISGDYQTYEQLENVVTPNGDVTLKGRNNLFNLMIWGKDGYSFAVFSNESLPQKTMLDLEASVEISSFQ